MRALNHSNTSSAIDMPEFNTLTISHIKPQPDGITLGFEVPESLRAHYSFVPGQYLTLRATINNEDIRRSYSICSYHKADVLEVGIKRVPGGVFSNFAAELTPGDTLQVMTPEGRFTANIGGQHNYLLVAAGSGITPCLSIAHSVLQDEPTSRITLLYGNRTSQSIMFRQEIDDLKDSYNERFMLVHVLSAENQDAALFNGRINADKLKRFDDAGLIDAKAFDAVYLCGPKEMTEHCSAALAQLGVDKSRIKFELFFTGNEPTPIRKTVSASDAQSGTPVKIIIDGVERTVQVNDETVLAAAQKSGLDLPFSCAGGMCCTCRCKVVSGETAMDVNFSLADWEIEAGFTLACQTRATGGGVVLDFDAS